MNPNKNPSRVAVAAILISLLTMPALAQVTGAANTAASSAAQASTAAQAASRPMPPPAITTPPVTPAVPVAPTAATNAAISTGAQTSAQTAAQQAQTSGGINGSVAGSTALQADPNGVAAGGTVNSDAAIAGQAPMTSATAVGSGPITASLNSANTVAQINGAAFQARDGVVTQIGAQVSTANRQLGTVRTSGRALTGDARKEFDSAYTDVRAKERQLRQTLSEVQNAKDDTWVDARARLASDYDAYAQAMARAEAAAQANATANP